ncbi:MAG: transposase [bacterium]|nr:transposase [bacterium]
MPYRIIPFVTGDYYHLYNKSFDEQVLFQNRRDYSRFLETLFYYQIQNPKPKFSTYRMSKIFPVDESKKVVEILCYCLMPNHFHLLVKQICEGGISEFMRKAIHSFTKYRNVKYKKQGPLLNGIFKAVRVESDEQLMHLSRYIHLNPLVSGLVRDLKFYSWTSYLAYIGVIEEPKIAKDEMLKFFKSPLEYQQFVLSQADYGKELELLKHMVLEEI